MDKSTGTDRGSTILSADKEYTLDSIIEDYTTYGYLENDQVLWLIDKLQKVCVMANLDWDNGTPEMKLTQIKKILRGSQHEPPN